MPPLKNLHYSAVSIEIEDGKTLTLGPQETAEVSDRVAASEQVQRLVRQGTLTILKERPDVNITGTK